MNHTRKAAKLLTRVAPVRGQAVHFAFAAPSGYPQIRPERRGFLQRRACGPQPSAAPPIVSEILLSPGQPLDAETRAYMEPRFGHDFGQVRVHTGARAAESARAVDALAYTVGRDLVFAAGAYTPGTMAGKRLIAHELTHVVQQAGTSVALLQRQPRGQRSPDEPTRREIRRGELLRRLAVWPHEALDAWRSLRPGEQSIVTFYMAARYGSDFAREFLARAQRRRRPEPVHHWTNILTSTHEQLQQRGYRLAVVSMGIEHWVHPTGSTLHRTLPSHREEAPAPAEETPAMGRQPVEEPPENPPHIDLPSDPESLFGPRIRSRDNAELLGYRGRAVEYGDGTILLYRPGSSTPFIYRTYPGSTGDNVVYEFYDENGDKAQGIYLVVDPDDVFGPTAEEGP